MGVNFRYPTLAPRRNPTPERMGTTTILSNATAVIPSPPNEIRRPIAYDDIGLRFGQDMSWGRRPAAPGSPDCGTGKATCIPRMKATSGCIGKGLRLALISAACSVNDEKAIRVLTCSQ